MGVAGRARPRIGETRKRRALNCQGRKERETQREKGRRGMGGRNGYWGREEGNRRDWMGGKRRTW